MSTTVTVCITCRHKDDPAPQPAGDTAGARLADAMDAAARGHASAPRIVRHECLWACAEGCAIVIGGDGKTGYVAGRFAPTAEAAEAILDWRTAHAASADGAVGYRFWPEGMKGHFIARIPQRGGDSR